MSKEFYVLSLKWTKRSEGLITWWGPRDSGYVFRLERAGRYTAEQIAARPSYYNDRAVTVAILCDAAESVAIRVRDSRSDSLDAVEMDDRVVEFKHMRRFRPRKKAAS